LLAAGQYEAALAVTEAGLREPAGHDLALRRLAVRAASAAGRPLSAYQHVTAAIEIATPDDPIHQTLGIAEGDLQQLANQLLQAGALTEAADLARSMLVSGVVSPDTYLVLAASEARLGGDALSTLEIGVLRYPDYSPPRSSCDSACRARSSTSLQQWTSRSRTARTSGLSPLSGSAAS